MASSDSSPGHAFLSYVREDAAIIDRLERILTASGVKVWRDTSALWPGEDWRKKIKQAVADDSLAFIACFSPASVAKPKSYQNEELVLAVEQIRLRPPGVPWLIPVRLGDCEPPDYDLGAGRALSDLQRVDLFPDDQWDVNVIRLAQAVQRILAQATPSAPSTARPPTGDDASVSPSVTQRLKSMLREPARQIDLEDDVTAITEKARTSLRDLTLFPVQMPAAVGAGQNDQLLFLAEQCLAYWKVVRPVAEAVATGCAWGLPEQNPLWTRAVQSVARTAAAQFTGQVVFLDLRRFATLPVLYAGALAAVHRGRFDALKAITTDAQTRNRQNEPVPVIADSHVWLPFQEAQLVPQVQVRLAEGGAADTEVIDRLRARTEGARFTPVSDTLFYLLRAVLAQIVPDDQEYEELFDRTEIMLGLIATDDRLEAQGQGAYRHGPSYGRFTWKDRYSRDAREAALHQEAAVAGASWPPLAAGLFGGSAGRAEAALSAFVAGAADARSRQH